MSTDVKFCWLKSIPALWGLNKQLILPCLTHIEGWLQASIISYIFTQCLLAIHLWKKRKHCHINRRSGYVLWKVVKVNSWGSMTYPAKTKKLYNIYTMLDQNQRRWFIVVWILWKSFVFTGYRYSVNISFKQTREHTFAFAHLGNVNNFV